MKRKPARATIEIRLRKTGADLFVVEVWRLEPRDLSQLEFFEQWKKISETPEIPRGMVDQQFSRAFHDYQGDPLTMAWRFSGLYEMQVFEQQLDEEVRKGRKDLKRRKRFEVM